LTRAFIPPLTLSRAQRHRRNLDGRIECIGSPAKVKRALTLEEQKDIARWAWSYVETSKHFREFYSRQL
jgi:carbonic anhydrase/acetyltransferase-like protein (isoleucine patch superfamily)